jgi:hypothetical protein
MRVILTKIGSRKESKHGSFYIRCFFKCLDCNKYYRLDVYDGHSNSRRWMPFLKEQGIFDNVNVFKNNIIDGNSKFIFNRIKL